MVMDFNDWLVKFIGAGPANPLFLLNPFGLLEIREVKGKEFLCRHPDMEKNVITECNLLREDAKAQSGIYEGILTLVYFTEDRIIPYFATATEIYGRDGFALNRNLQDTKQSNKVRNFFARWGDDYERHFGQLSNAMFPENGVKFAKVKLKWVEDFFTKESSSWTLKRGVFFAAKAWARDSLAWDGKHYYVTDMVEKLKKGGEING